MNIQSISKEKRQVIVCLDADELVKICNVFYETQKAREKEKRKDKLYYKLYSDMMLARDLSQYGHIDSFCLGQIVKHRSLSGETLDVPKGMENYFRPKEENDDEKNE